MLWVPILFLSIKTVFTQDVVYVSQDTKVYFQSAAPLELIEASSAKLQGVIDPVKRTFAFSIPVRSFKGFNSPLQWEHFNENFMESHKFPSATFSGKIIENVNIAHDGTYIIRAKGKLSVHGIEQERIIKSIVTVKNNKAQIKSAFSIILAEHKIAIPKIIHQKIAEEVFITVEGSFDLVNK